jgi:hypothetical protein
VVLPVDSGPNMAIFIIGVAPDFGSC